MSPRSGTRLASACLLPVLAIADASASPPFVLDDGDVEDLGHVEIDVGSLMTVANNGRQGDLLYTEVDYGALPDTEIDAVVPTAFSDATTGGFKAGIGDAQVETKVRIVDPAATAIIPTIAFDPTLSIPTGNAARGLGTGHVQLFLPFWASKTVGDWTVFGGGGPAINPGAGQRDYVQFGVGLDRALHDGWSVGGELYETTRQGAAVPASLAADADVGRDLSDRARLFASIGRSFGPGAALNRASVFVGLQITR